MAFKQEGDALFAEGEMEMKERCLAALLLVLLLSGCGGRVDRSAPEDLQPAEFAAQDGAMTAEQTEKEARPLTGEEVLSAYDQAVEAYGWFELTPLPSGSGAVEVDGSSYLPVDRQGMTTMLELRSYLRSLFSEDVTNQLLATGGKRRCTGKWMGRCMCAPTAAGRRIRIRAKSALRSSRKARPPMPSM